MVKVAIAAYEGLRLFDLAVAHEVWRPDRLPIEVALCGIGDSVSTGVASVAVDRGWPWLEGADLVIVPGSERPSAFAGPGLSPSDARMITSLRRAHRRGAVVASMCAGAFVLAAAGLLDGRRATTHWSLAPALVAAFPKLILEEQAIFVRDGDVWSSAGTAAGIDLSLALVRRYVGHRAADATSRRLVAAPFRRGDQAQFIQRPVPEAGPDSIAEVAARVVEADFRQSWSVVALAHAVGVSARTLARRLPAETGSTVHAWILGKRMEEARRLLVETDLPVESVATRAGFGSAVTMRQHFARELSMSPADYRAANR